MRETASSAHHVAGPDTSWIRSYGVTTGPSDGSEPACSQADCDAMPLPGEAERALGDDCDPCREDTGWCREDTGWGSCDHGRDTGDSGEDPGDTGDTGNLTVDTGDGGAP